MSTTIPIEMIKESKHILIKSDEAHFPQASVLYSYLLTQHKKVSLYMEEKKHMFAFLPWYDKVRVTEASSAELTIDVSMEIMDLYDFLKSNGVTINKKMATALYAGFLKRYNNFLAKECDGTVFAVLSELIEYKAQYQMCLQEMIYSKPLSLFRLKALAYKKLLLVKNARVAKVVLCDEDFESCGAQWSDVKEVANEILKLAHVEEVHIIKSDEKDKILKIVKDI
jgi:hypothetical protein